MNGKHLDPRGTRGRTNTKVMETRFYDDQYGQSVVNYVLNNPSDSDAKEVVYLICCVPSGLARPWASTTFVMPGSNA